jgi:hypothetical protein
VLAWLAAYGVLPSPLPDALREYAHRAVRNTRGEVVGVMQVAEGDVGDRYEMAP